MESLITNLHGTLKELSLLNQNQSQSTRVAMELHPTHL